MKVKELIEELQKLNQEREVKVGEYYSGEAKNIKRIDKTIFFGAKGEYYRIDTEI